MITAAAKLVRRYLALLILPLAPLPAQVLPQRDEDPIPPQVEQIYQRGLQFLAKQQTQEGAWDDQGSGNEPGVVGLAVCAFLACGEDPNHGPYAEAIRKGLKFILTNQRRSNGYIGSSMYNHGFATLALAEAYGMVDEPELGPALQKAVDLILSSQERNRSNGWRYTPDSLDADSSVAGCQMVALFAARNAGIGVPEEAIRKGLAYLASCRSSTDGSYGYTSASDGRPTLTAVGSLCLSLAKDRDSRGFTESLNYLKKNLDFRDRNYPYYYEYYMAQALFHADQEVWQDWNLRNLRYLATIQANDGSFPGPQGTAFSTTGALLSLALNFRFLPIYEK